MVSKRLCSCGCGERVARKVEEQHMNALAPAFLTSQVLNQNRRLIRRKKRSQTIGFPSRVRQQLSMGNTTEIDNMDIDHDNNDHVSLDHDEAYGQSRSGRSQHVAPHAGPSSLTDPPNEDILEAYGQSRSGRSRHVAPYAGPLSLADPPNEDILEAYSQSRSGHSRHVAPHAGPSSLTDPPNEDILETYSQSKSGCSRHVAPHGHAGPSSLTDPPNEDIFMDHPAPSISPDPLPDDDAGMHIGENIDAEVYGLSNLRRSRRVADSVKRISEQRWGSNASVHFVDNREESDEEEEDIEDDESINDFDIDVDRDVASDEDEDDEMFAGPGQEGISLWDSLGEGFLTEASQLGMSTLFW